MPATAGSRAYGGTFTDWSLWGHRLEFRLVAFAHRGHAYRHWRR